MKKVIDNHYWENRKRNALKIYTHRKQFAINKKELMQLEKYLSPGIRGYFIKDFKKADEFAMKALKITSANLKHEEISTSRRYFYYQQDNFWISYHQINLERHLRYNTLDFLVLGILFRKTFEGWDHKNINILYGTFYLLSYKLYCFNIDYNQPDRLSEKSIFNLMQNSIDEAYYHAQHTNEGNNLKKANPKYARIIDRAMELKKKKDIQISYTNNEAIIDASGDLRYLVTEEEIIKLNPLLRQKEFRIRKKNKS